MLAVRRQQYLQTQNPVYVWSAIAMLADEPRRTLPAWIRDYLARVAANIDGLSRRRIPRKDEPPRAVYRALEFGAAAVVNPFAAQADVWHRLTLAIEVNAALGPLPKLDAAIHHVVQTHRAQCVRVPPCRQVSRSTVLRAWQTYKHLVATDPTT
jgi:hypothetical protein